MLWVKIDSLAKKIYFVQNTPQKGLFCVHESALPDFGRQTLDTRSTSEVPLKSYGGDGSNEICGRLVASKLSAYRVDTFFPFCDFLV